MKQFFIPRLPKDKGFTPPLRARTGFTLVEAVFTISILAMVMAAMIPFIRTVHTTWNIGDRKTELQQNARVGLEMISRFLRQAKRIMGIPASGSGNFVKFRMGQIVDNIFLEDAQTIIFYHNIPTSVYYIGNTGLIKENDLVMRTINVQGAINNALLAKSLSNFRIDFKDALGGIVTKPYNVSSMNISMSLTDPQNLIPDTVEIFSSISVRPEVKISKPVWVGAGSYVIELSMDNWISGFLNPNSLSVDSSEGSCWVADTGNNLIKKISPTGTISTYAGFKAPQSVSVNSTTHDCWVADTGDNRIKKITLSGTIDFYAGYKAPQSVSVNPTTHECWVADTYSSRDQIKKLSAEGKVLVKISGFNQPYCVSVNPDIELATGQSGVCWVADTGNNLVKKITPTGTISSYTGFNRPLSVSVNSATGECWVADTGNNRIRKLSPTGVVLVNVIGFNSPQYVLANPIEGSCWVADTGSNQVVKLDSQGNEEFRISGFKSPLSVGAKP